ncbi:peptidase M23-like protein [Saccharothrix saharensis]|uniref:Peptidase M23-like protein n=1 Tax=Saccharothrix saharensis TaxID=571190 RepID=A0A543JKP6_9PSEU|nr:peptidase M23-like protein [Saccharothrix saharensis]
MTPTMRTLLVLALTATVTLPLAPQVQASRPPRFAWPLAPPHRVVRPFDPPATEYAPGHRGVDLAAAPGSPVLAAADAVVVHAGPVADRAVVSLLHPGGLRTTYEPLHPTVHRGQRVRRGTPIGTLDRGHEGCPAEACLHWGAFRPTPPRSHTYLDPLHLLTNGRVRLLPHPTRPRPAQPATHRAQPPTAPSRVVPPSAPRVAPSRPPDQPPTTTSPASRRLLTPPLQPSPFTPNRSPMACHLPQPARLPTGSRRGRPSQCRDPLTATARHQPEPRARTPRHAARGRPCGPPIYSRVEAPTGFRTRHIRSSTGPGPPARGARHRTVRRHRAGSRPTPVAVGGQDSSCSFNLVRSRSTARVCSWHTRDSVTPRTLPISASVRFSK